MILKMKSSTKDNWQPITSVYRKCLYYDVMKKCQNVLYDIHRFML